MKNIKISVIIPVYNEERYLEECLDSVLSQTLRDIEVICVDDGSTDQSAKIVEEYIKKDNRVMLLKQKNKYAGTARNHGMKYAAGRYLCFLDGDDFFSPVFLECMYTAAKQHLSDVVICNNSEYDTNTGQITKGFMRETFLPENKQCFNRKDIPERLFQVTDGWPWNKLFRTDFVKENELFFSETRTANDCYFVYMALALAGRITKISDYLVNWRINNCDSLSNTRERSWHCSFQVLYDMKQKLKDLELYEKLERTFLNFALDHLMWSLERASSFTGKEHIYQCIQTECKEKLGITDLMVKDYHNKDLYEEYRYIESHPLTEYLAMISAKRIKELEMSRRYSKELNYRLSKKVWMFPYHDVIPESSIVLYGAGQVGQDYYRQIRESGYCKVVLWMDRKFETQEGELEIHGWRNRLADVKFDQIIIALLQKDDREKVRDLLKSWGISEEKILWDFAFGKE